MNFGKNFLVRFGYRIFRRRGLLSVNRGAACHYSKHKNQTQSSNTSNIHFALSPQKVQFVR
jgi:hypothetical protein